MPENISLVVGYTAAFLTTISFIPQALKTLKEKDTKGISLHMYLIFTFGIFLWFVYGLLIKSTPIIIANFITLILTSTICFFKIKYK
ncbi:hypothetical protein A3C23_04285 [Candidatus Roizmanbacteria bacterium RIFCSPHIGHO2_02_FULL_37_13b]|uniref:Glutathione synthetase n=1 Tax=Candidatus Roizmanbacteria bacterium RIFCSPLOWO2_02_FULL_36_11 TaxID=1802071 RepID=A0A1F7JH47_9BACT|nr:MAG: hypothetical protein A3C23_04285 [Candidatus Roizmanbacteria bacterium RIFCSPHIGHO2_02_FULL_37_13b]OGK54928.1 MAG: hypothetical protein A3H78_00430 [Candidatus Roizmanbacteria bacterium RIFCSPLOWO2_02_FULL_36_11]